MGAATVLGCVLFPPLNVFFDFSDITENTKDMISFMLFMSEHSKMHHHQHAGALQSWPGPSQPIQTLQWLYYKYIYWT